MHRVAAERQLPGDHPVPDDAHRVLIRPAVHLLALGLLRGHVVRRADDHPGAREGARRLEGLGNPEIGEHHAAVVVEHDVRGLHVAVHDAALVRVAQRARRLPQHPLDVVGGEWLLLLEHVLQRCAGDVLHHEVVEAALALDPVDRDDVGVVELGRGLRFLLESLDYLRVLRNVGWQDLDGDLAVERQVVRKEDRPHPALPHHPLDLVLALHDALQPGLQALELGAGARGRAAAGLVRPASEAELAVIRQRGVALEALHQGRRNGDLDGLCAEPAGTLKGCPSERRASGPAARERVRAGRELCGTASPGKIGGMQPERTEMHRE